METGVQLRHMNDSVVERKLHRRGSLASPGRGPPMRNLAFSWLTLVALGLVAGRASADPIGPDCGTCQGSIYTLEYSGSPIATTSTTETFRITLTIDTSGYNGGGDPAQRGGRQGELARWSGCRSSTPGRARGALPPVLQMCQAAPGSGPRSHNEGEHTCKPRGTPSSTARQASCCWDWRFSGRPWSPCWLRREPWRRASTCRPCSRPKKARTRGSLRATPISSRPTSMTAAPSIASL